MTMKNKQELIAQVTALLNAALETEEAAPAIPAEPPEMLTIKECAKAVKGLSENTIRKLVAQNRIPCIRTGQLLD